MRFSSSSWSYTQTWPWATQRWIKQSRINCGQTWQQTLIHADLKQERNIKSKLTHNKRECRATGGGQYNKYVMTPLEERVAVLWTFICARMG